MQNRKLFALLALMAGMTALSVDIYLPSMPALAAYLKVSSGTLGLTVSIFFLSFAFGQLLYGPLSDLYGRRKPLLGGLALYLVANLLCTAAFSIEMLLVGRFLQGLGACAGSVIAQAVVRDRAAGSEGTRVLASVASATALAPIIAPILGGLLETHFSWRASFLFLALFGLVLWLMLYRSLPETAPPASGQRGLQALLRGYRKVFWDPAFLYFTALGAAAFGALFAFISVSSTLMVEGMGFSPDVYGVLFALNASTFMLGSMAAKRLADRFDNRNMALIGMALIGGGGLLMWGGAALLGSSLWTLLPPMALVTAGVALVSPAAIAGAMAGFSHQAGTASALHGFFRFSAAALMSAVLGLFPIAVVNLGVAITLCGGLGLFLSVVTRAVPLVRARAVV